MSAGSVNPVARAAAPLVVRVQRRPGDQELERITAAFPPGVSAALRTVTPCAVARARTGGCPEASRIGTATIGAGPGAWPLYLQGKVFLTESYGGGRFGLSIAVPAVAGPFDLGTVVVRAAVDVDPTTARLTVRSDPLPRILRGVVLRLRDIHLAIDRPGFARNPTNCGRKGIGVTVEGGDGATSSQTVPFRVGDCSALRFRPRFSVALVGRRMIPDARVGLRVRVRARARDANLRRVAFTLPPQIAFDALRRGPRLCSRARLDARSCPKGSKVGTARATSPLLARPLKGPVYFIRGVRGDPFPKLAMLLDGELRIDLLGSTAVRHNGLRTTFGTLPDVPIAAFELRLERGMLTPTRHLCRRRLRARLEMTAQNGRRSDRSVPIRVPCKG